MAQVAEPLPRSSTVGTVFNPNTAKKKKRCDLLLVRVSVLLLVQA
jgi:hypothetical protein